VATAQDTISLRKIKAGVYISPPFVMHDTAGYYSGMAIDLWEMMEDRMDFQTEYIRYPGWSEMMQAVASGEIDVAVSSISVTYERARQLKFSFPWFDSGLRIMVKSNGQGTIWNELKRNGHLQSYLWIFAIILLLTLILTFIHRHSEPKFPRNWVEGITESLYRLVLALKTGVVNNKNYSWMGKILAVTWMLAGVGLVAYVTSSITSSMTAVALTHEIHSLSDLPGKRVGVLAGTTGEEYMQNRGIPVTGYVDMEEAAQALLNDEIDAVVEDTPVLEYWVYTHPQHKMEVVGNIFHPDKYAFAAIKNNSAFMDRISVEIIRLFDLEQVGRIKDKYFGNVH